MVEEREDPFSPPPTEAEKRAEEDRRIRDLVRPLIDQMRDGLGQGLNGQVQEAVKGAVEDYLRQSRGGEVQQPQGKKRAKAPGAADDKEDAEDEKAEREERRLEAAVAKATEMAGDADPARREEGRARLEQIRRGRMPKWSSGEGVFFIGCINKRKLYRDRYGDIFQSELWFNGSSGAGGIGGNAYAAAARSGQQTAAAGAPPAGQQGGSASLDPCSD
jgi:hypothetical protein